MNTLSNPRIVFVEKVSGAVATAAFLIVGGPVAAAVIGSLFIAVLGVSAYLQERNDNAWGDPMC